MTGAAIAAAVIKYGPEVIFWIEELVAVWNKEMTPEELLVFCQLKRKSIDQRVADILASRGTPPAV